MNNGINVLIRFVWATWDRVPLIIADMERSLHRFIQAICLDHGCNYILNQKAHHAAGTLWPNAEQTRAYSNPLPALPHTKVCERPYEC